MRYSSGGLYDSLCPGSFILGAEIAGGSFFMKSSYSWVPSQISNSCSSGGVCFSSLSSKYFLGSILPSLIACRILLILTRSCFDGMNLRLGMGAALSGKGSLYSNSMEYYWKKKKKIIQNLLFKLTILFYVIICNSFGSKFAFSDTLNQL